MKNLFKNLIGGIIGVIIIVGIFTLLCKFVEWVCIDAGRFWLAIVIIGYVIYRMLSEELDK